MNLRIAAIVDHDTVPAWQCESLKRVAGSAQLKLVLVMSGRPGASRRSNPLLNLYGRIDSRMFRYHPDATRPLNIRDELSNAVPVRAVRFERDGEAFRLSAPDAVLLKESRPDVILWFTTAPPVADVASIAPCGLWFFGADAADQAGSSEPGLREMIADLPVVCSTLRVWREGENRGSVLVRSFSRTHRLSLNKTRNITLWKRVPFPARKLEELSRLGPERFFRRPILSDPEFLSTRVEPVPGYLTAFQFLARQVFRIASTAMRRKLSFEQWCLAVSFEKGISMPFERYTRMIPPKDRFWADPHQVREKGECFVFLEEFPYSTGKGHISVTKLSPDGTWTLPVPVLRQPYHLSYPFVFSWQDTYFMIPETSKNMTIEVYQCSRFPDSWELKMTLMENVRAVDTTLLHHGGKWWLFANIAEVKGAETVDELFLFSADHFLTRTWIPHPMNPVVSDVRRARPAGRIFAHEGALYRPSQDCSEEYGGGINFFRIDRLSDEEYAETFVSSYRPSWDRSVIGLHTYSCGEDVTLIDLSVRRKKWR